MISEITQLSLPKYMKYKNKRYLNYILLSSFREDFLLDCSPLLFTRQILLLQPLNYLDCTTPPLSLSVSLSSTKSNEFPETNGAHSKNKERESLITRNKAVCNNRSTTLASVSILDTLLVHFGRGSRGRDGRMRGRGGRGAARGGEKNWLQVPTSSTQFR